MPGDASERKEIFHGIRLVLEEIRELKRESAEYQKQSAEYQRQSAEYQKQAAEDRRWFREFMERSDARFEQYVRGSERRERRISQALAVIGKVGRDILAQQKAQTAMLHEHTALLKQLVKGFRTFRNGRQGNGA